MLDKISLPVFKRLTFPSMQQIVQKCSMNARMIGIAREALKTLAICLIGGATVMALSGFSFVTTGIVAAIALTAMGFSYGLDKLEAATQTCETRKAFETRLLDQVTACIENDSQYSNKEEILDLLAHLRQIPYFVQTGSDDIRVKFVGSQGAIEHVLACQQAANEIHDLIGIIHTPLPATPLCTKPNGDFALRLLDASIVNDVDKQQTVKSRAEIVREYLEKNGKLLVVYPKGGLEKRKAEEQAIYLGELQKYQGRLMDWELESDEFDPNMIGATYLFRDREENLYSFSIKARQANDIQQEAEWGIWLGTIAHPSVRQRVNTIFDFLKEKNGPDLRQEFLEFVTPQ